VDTTDLYFNEGVSSSPECLDKTPRSFEILNNNLDCLYFDLKAQAFSASTRFCTVFGRELAFRPTNVFGFPIKLLDEEDLTVISLKLPSRAREIL